MKKETMAQELSNPFIQENGVSVIVPVYNGAPYIHECVDALLNQTLNRIQIILVNDGSTDQSGAILDQYGEEFDQITVIHQENKGVSAARNTGLLHCVYSYVGFVDADDIPSLEQYEKLLRAIRQQGTDCVCCDYKVVPYRGPSFIVNLPFESRIYQKEEIIESLIKPLLGLSKGDVSGLPSVCNKLFSVNLIRQHGIQFAQRQHGEDWLFILEYLRYIDQIFFLHETLYTYLHRSTQSLVYRFRPEYFRDCVDSIVAYESIYPEFSWKTTEIENKDKDLPYRVALYYHKHKRGMELRQLYLKLMEEIRISELKSRFESQIVSACDAKDENRFIKLVNRKTWKAYSIFKIKSYIKRIIR